MVQLRGRFRCGRNIVDGLSSEIISGHFVGFWQVEEGEQGGGNVAQGAAVAQFSPVGGVNEYKGYGVGGVGGVGFAGVVVDHLFGVAVVSGDDGRSVCFFYGFEDAVQAGVNCGDGLYCGVEDAGVTDHVGVGEVAYCGVVLVGCDGFCESVCDFRCAHFGFVVVGGDVFGGLDEDAFFSIKGRFPLAVEEEGDVGVFFCFCDAKLSFVRPGDD